MKPQNQNKRPSRFICDDGGMIARKVVKSAPMAFEDALKTALDKHLHIQSTIDAFDLPFDDAIAYFRDKANVTTRHWHDVYGAAASRSFWVAGVTSEELLQDFRQAIDKAISQGTTLQEFRKDFDKIVAQHGWSGWTGEDTPAGRAWRQAIIYDANLRNAYSAGRYAASMRPEVLAHFPNWQYHHSGSLNPRHEHLAWDGKIWRADDPVWITIYPTNGWRCGCYVTLVSDDELIRLGKNGPEPSPDIIYVATDIGGKRVMTPKGVDAGFGYNPGREWLKRTAPGNETMAASSGMIERFVEAAIKNKLISNAYTPVALAGKKIAKHYDLPTQTEIRLSQNTIARHLKHSSTTPAIYARIVEYAVSEGKFIIEAKGNLTSYVEYDGKLWLVGLKKTRNNEIYVTTVHRTEPRKFESQRRRDEQL